MIRLLFILSTCIGCAQPCDYIAAHDVCVYYPQALPVDLGIVDDAISYVDSLVTPGAATLAIEPTESGESIVYDVSERGPVAIATWSPDPEVFFSNVATAYRLALHEPAYNKP